MQRQRWRELNTVCYAVQMAFFKSAHDLLLVGEQEGLLDEEEFLLLHDLNTSSFKCWIPIQRLHKV